MKLAASLVLGLAIASGCFADAFTFSADRVQSVLAVGKEKTILSGKARVKSDRITISADAIEISGKNYNLLVCRGNVIADDTKKGIHLQAPNLTYDRSLSLALLLGPSILEDGANRVVLKADWIQDDGDKGITLAQVNVRILKEGLACRSEYVVYRRAEHILELSGAPRVVKNGDEYRATRMVVNTDTEEIKLEGQVSGSVHSGTATAPSGSSDSSAAPASPAPPAGSPDTAAPGKGATPPGNP